MGQHVYIMPVLMAKHQVRACVGPRSCNYIVNALQTWAAMGMNEYGFTLDSIQYECVFGCVGVFFLFIFFIEFILFLSFGILLEYRRVAMHFYAYSHCLFFLA